MNHVLEHVPLNTSEIDQALLNIEQKERSNPLPWNGQFSPQFVGVLLDRYASPGECILDPFVGSGTVLLESSARDIVAWAADINPAACYLARLYSLANLPVDERHQLCRTFKEALSRNLPDIPLLRGVDRGSLTEQKKDLIAKLRAELEGRYAITVLAGCIVLSDFFDPHTQPGELLEAYSRLKSIIDVLPYSRRQIKVLNADARKLPIKHSTVDLVITSPPYVNVFNYHQYFRQTVEALGWHLLRVAKAEVGSNRKHRSNRFLTVIQYCLDMALVFQEIRRVCKTQSRTIFVVGRESRVRGVPFYNGGLIASVAQAVGFRLITRQERVFTNRFGRAIFEDILHFEPSRMLESEPLAKARDTALLSLHDSLSTTTGEVNSDIREAIQLAREVNPSPLYDRSEAFKPTISSNGAAQ